MAQTPLTKQFKDLGGCTMGLEGCVTGIFSPALNVCFLSCLVTKIYLVTNYIVVCFDHHLRPRFNAEACVDGRWISKFMN